MRAVFFDHVQRPGSGDLYERAGRPRFNEAFFLLYAVFFQLSDALAAPIQGALRGYKDVNVTLFVALVSYWVIGLPTGYWLAHSSSLGAYGYWIGLITGLAFGAAGLFTRLLHVQRHPK